MKLRRAKHRAVPYVTEWGFKLGGDLSHAMGFGRADLNRINSGEAHTFITLFKQVDAFVDIGANIGIYSLLASQRKLPTVAIEPSPHNFKELVKNIKLNEVKCVEPLNLAVGQEPGRLTLFGDGEMASLNKGWGGAANTVETQVDVNTLDNLCAHRFEGDQLLIKVDVEGHEAAVLDGAEALLNRTPAPLWIIEHNCEKGVDQAGQDPILRRMFELGYAALPVGQAEASWLKRSDPLPSDGDFLFAKTPSKALLKQLSRQSVE